MDVAGESAQAVAFGAERGRSVRRALVGLIAGAGLAGGALFLYAGLGRSARQEAPPTVTRPAPDVPQSMAAGPDGAGVAPQPLPAPLPVTPPVPAARPPAQPAATNLPAPAAKRDRKRGHPTKPKTRLEYAPEGVPIMP